MDYKLCGRFRTLRAFFPDESDKSTDYDFHNNGSIRNYCPNGDSGNTKECKTDLDKINAACLWLFEQIIINNIDSLSKEKSEVFIIYIMIWLSYMLNLKNVNNIKSLKDFYTNHIKNNTHYTTCNKSDNDCSNSLKNKTGYNNFKEIIEANKCFMSINITDMSKFYGAFKSLCEMYSAFDGNTLNCTKNLNHANEFVKKYKELSGDSSITENSSCNQVLSTLSTDYNNLKNKCNDAQGSNFPTLSEVNTPQITTKGTEQASVTNSAQNSNVTSSSSSIVSKVIPVLSIFAAIPIFLGISYKYSLFGFRKKVQKHLREKLKK
ncbi:BIR protein [Plasmodium berghei]|uniref:BIR protein n=3 Tax=Plasmodium berghei TaxID=5821 RepID=A0A509AHS4_PLABA|nr:BIR protein [Plasmodium berghei ANKA]SCL87927.1 BIR protein [Plasmodium berghei]VUC54920.1 BIR protein [Plasmodium berghei ANKA]|eukprot:XP_034420740.1 BIR protein [Plasmodium berghei ANKA]